MKKIYIGFFMAAAIAVITIVSCSKNEIQLKPETLTEIEQVGIIHNAVLDSVLNELCMARVEMFLKDGKSKIVNTRGSTDNEMMSDLAYNKCLQALKNYIPENDVDEIASADFTKEKAMQLIDRVRAGNFVLTETRQNDFVKTYSRKLLGLFDSDDISYNQIMSDINALEEEIKRTADNTQEAEAMLQITSVARYSTTYWHQNESKWHLVMNSVIVGEINYPITRSGGEEYPQFFPFKNDETMFFMILANGTAYAVKCPGDLVWNQATCTCVRREQQSGGGGAGSGGWFAAIMDSAPVKADISSAVQAAATATGGTTWRSILIFAAGGSVLALF